MFATWIELLVNDPKVGQALAGALRFAGATQNESYRQFLVSMFIRGIDQLAGQEEVTLDDGALPSRTARATPSWSARRRSSKADQTRHGAQSSDCRKSRQSLLCYAPVHVCCRR